MRTDEETKEIIKQLATSPDFLAALESCDEGVNPVQLCFHMFCAGYISCLDYMEAIDKLRVFKY